MDWNITKPQLAMAIPGTPLYEYSQQIGVIGKTLDEEEDYLIRTSNSNNKSILNDRRGCPSSPRNYTSEGTQKWKEDYDVYKWDGNVRWKPNTHLCISKEAMIKPTSGEDIPGIPGKSWLLICSTSNTTQSGSDRCHYNNRKKIDYRYVIKVNRDLKIEVYKYNLKKDKWILQ